KLAQKRPVIEDYETATPKREAERGELYAEVADLMAKAELTGSSTNLAGVLPSALKRKVIQKLADHGRALTPQPATPLKSAETEGRALNKARGRAMQTPKPRPIDDLARVLTAADKLGDITSDIAKRTRALERRTKALNETIIGLGVGTDHLSALRELKV